MSVSQIPEQLWPLLDNDLRQGGMPTSGSSVGMWVMIYPGV